MKFSKTKALTIRLFVTLALAAACAAGYSGIAEAATCFTCHAPAGQSSDIRPFETAPYRNITTGSVKGSHIIHMPVTTAPSACTPCHGTASAGFTTKHRDGFISVTTATTKSLGYSRGAKVAQSGSNPTLGFCATTYCHSSGQATPTYVNSPTWGVAAGLTCGGCHGFNAAAANKITTNKHAAHVNNGAFLGSNYSCGECHTTTVAAGTDSPVTASANHINGAANYSGAKAYKTGYPVSLGACTTYCHSSGKKGLVIGGVVVEPVNPSWNAVAQLLDCADCHGAATGGASFTSQAGEPNYPNVAANVLGSNSHQKHVGTIGSAATCINCHNNTVDAAGALKAVVVHTDKTIDVIQGPGMTFTWTPGTRNCATISCHSGAAAVWGATLTCESCHGFNAAATNKITTNKHAAHVNNANFLGSNYTCGECHTTTVAAGTDSPVTATANHANGLANYSGAKAYKAGYTIGSLGACATYCHSSGKKGLVIASVVVEPVNPSWNAAVQVLDCKGCHGGATGTGVTASSIAGDPNYPNVAANVLGSNSHNKHVGAAAATSCEACHTNSIDAAGVLKTGVNHTNKTLDVNFNLAKAGASVTWTAGTKTCSNISCHSGSSAVWGATLTCESCHGFNAAATNKITTNKHAAHVNNGTFLGSNYSCGECHSTTVAAGTDSPVTVSANHVNLLANYSGAKAYKAGYTIGSLTTCTTYCHSSGKKGLVIASVVVEPANPSWNAVAQLLDCRSCHGGATGTGVTASSIAGDPNYPNVAANVLGSNSHNKHVGAAAATSCEACHTNSIDAAGVLKTGANHTNKTLDVNFNLAKAGASVAWTQGTKTCSGISCHGGNSAVWGGTLYCQDCHNAATDADDFGPTFWANSAMSTINNTEWNNVGHGNAGKGNFAAVGAAMCLYCHDSAVTHGLGTNVFRLRTDNITWGSSNSWGPANGICTKCHATGGGGVTSPTTKNATLFVGSYHYGAKHSTSKTGGQFCWDCHDPHGDGTNIKMIGLQVAKRSSATTFAPVSSVTVTAFTADATGTDFAGTNTKLCNRCHTATGHYTSTASDGHNSGAACVSCHAHTGSTVAKGFEPVGGGESSGGSACGGCHNDLYNSVTGTYSMHSNVPSISYKHYMENDTAAYTNLVPNGPATNLTSRRCTMCHVDHDIFKVTASATAGRAFNLRGSATVTPTAGYNTDLGLCLSCHTTVTDKFSATPNGNLNITPIPFPGLSFTNATSVFNSSPHAYPILSTYSGNAGATGNTSFKSYCTKCHNDSIGGNLAGGRKSSVNGQDSKANLASHNSTVPGRFSIFSNPFYQLPAGVTITPGATTITLSTTPWVLDEHIKRTVVITSGTTGNNQRRRITTNTTNTLTVNTAFSPALSSDAKFDIVDDNLSVDNVCFSCHSQPGQGKPAGNALKDWYGQKSMKSKMEDMKNLFIGASGTSTGFTGRVTLNDTTQSWASSLVGYQLKIKSGANAGQTRVITVGAISSNFVTVNPGFSSNLAIGVKYEIVKPASHPLDAFGRHDSYERVNATSGWNKGDTGAATAATITSVTDGTKLWLGSEFSGMTVWFPGNFDGSGNPAKATIIAGGVGILTYAQITGYTALIGDPFFIGTATGGGRHVACADCHNTHASLKAPRGSVTSLAGANTLTDNTAMNVPGWNNGIWVGYLLKATSSAGFEQVRYISGFTKSSGMYTVSLNWSTPPAANDTYEVLLGDKWTAAGGQSGGRAGTGSAGVWGAQPTAWRLASATLSNMTGAVGMRKIDNVFDNVSSTGLRGGTVTGQRDLCIRCHSSYSYNNATPMTPSGNANGTIARSTDVLKEFNPTNLAHHAVYARGKNQPIRANYNQPTISSSMNPNWPIYSTGTDTVTVASGVATLSGTAALPKTALPGWFIYIGTSDTRTAITGAPGTPTAGYLEITSITSDKIFTVRTETATLGVYNTTISIGANQNWYVTSGLGNSFVPPYGPWSILRCTDCHGSTKTDPVGPHASVNKWLIKSADTFTFDYWNGSAVVTVVPGAPSTVNYFCFNCHRRDVYLDNNTYGTAVNATMRISRIPHGSAGMEAGKTHGGSVANTKWPQHCRNCHAGDRVGGIHGTNLKNTNPAPSGTLTNLQGKRFLNGSAWAAQVNGGVAGGLDRSTTSTYGTCYVGAITNATVDNCGSGHDGNVSYSNFATYDYDNP